MAEDFTGFDDFSKLLEKYIGKTEKGNVMQVLEIGAEDLARDVRALPKPRRPGGGRTHMLDSVVTKRRGEEIEVGWGKYYGPFVDKIVRKIHWKNRKRKCNAGLRDWSRRISQGCTGTSET